MAIYAQTSGTNQTNSGSFVPIPGLSITIPEGVGVTALVTLNAPNPYAKGNDYPGGTFGISVNGTVSPVVAVLPITSRYRPRPAAYRPRWWSACPWSTPSRGDVVGGARQYGDHRHPASLSAVL